MSLQSFFAPMRRELAFLAAQVIALAVLFATSLPLKIKDVPIYDEAQTIAFTQDEQTSATLSLMRGDWQVSAAGAAPKNADAMIEAPLPAGPWAKLQVTLIGVPKNEWIVTAQRGHERTTRLKIFAGTQVTFDGQQLPGKNPDAPLSLRIAPKEGNKGIIERVHVRLSAYAHPPPLSPIAAIFFVPLFPVSVFIFLRLAGRRETATALKISAVVSLLAILGFYYRPDILQGLWMGTAGLFFASAAAPFIRVLRGWDKDLWLHPATRQLAEISAVFALFGFALWMRWDALLAERLLPLRFDAAGYFHIALNGTFYQTALDAAPWVREPLLPALLRTWFAVFSVSETSARAAGVMIGALVPPLTYMVGRRIFSPLGAFLAAGVLALAPFAATLSASGLRDDLLSVLFLALIAAAIHLEKFPHWRAALIGIAAGAMALTRVSNLFFLIPILAWVAWRQRWKILEVASCLALFVLPVIPHLIFNAKIGGGDCLYSASVHTPYYINRLHIGEAGYPASIAEWNADPYRQLPAGDSLLGSGGLIAGAKRIISGYAKIFFWNFPHGQLFRGNELVMAFGLIGAWVLWRKREAWWVAIAYIVFMFPVAVIAAIVFDPRLASPAAPMIALVWGAGVDFAVANAWLALRKKTSPRR